MGHHAPRSLLRRRVGMINQRFNRYIHAVSMNYQYGDSLNTTKRGNELVDK